MSERIMAEFRLLQAGVAALSAPPAKHWDSPVLSDAAARLTEVQQMVDGQSSHLAAALRQHAQGLALPASLLIDLDRATELLVRDLPGSLNGLEEQLRSTTGYLEGLPGRLEDDGTAARDPELSSVAGMLEAALESWEQGLSEAVKQAFEEIESQAEELRDKIVETLQEEIEDSPEEFIAETEQAFADLLSDRDEQLRSAAQALASQCSEALDGLSEHALETVRREIDERMKEVLREVIETLAKDVLESTVLTQLAMTTTTALSPVLPQLIAARIALGPIQSALDALRMGA